MRRPDADATVPTGNPIDAAQASVTRALSPHAAPRVVEAGCGARSHLRYPDTAHVIGVDLIDAQLRRNTSTPHLVRGDVSALPIAPACADLVVCWDVLEHLPQPALAIAEIARVLRPGGLAVLALPHILSLKGLVTRFTPWWFHVWVYRRVLGDTSAGTDAFDQFPTTLRFSLRPAGIRRLARAHGLHVESLALYEGPVPTHFRRRHRVADLAFGAASRITRRLSAGRYDTTLSDMVIVLSRDGDHLA